MNEPTDEQMDAFEARLISLAATNSYSAALLLRWVTAQNREEKIAIMRHIDEAAQRIVSAFEEIGITARKAGEALALAISTGIAEHSKG